MRNTIKTLVGGAVVAVVPVFLMAASTPQRATHAIIDRSVGVAVPMCSLTTCDDAEGICESNKHYHTPKSEDQLASAVANETDPRTVVAVALAH
jgi:hypothetical protein